MKARAATILITGGAGYIGSQFARACLDAGHQVVIADDLSTGSLAAVPAASRFHQVDVTDTDSLASVLREQPIDVCAHFAAKLSVPESITEPEQYYRTNVGGLLSVLAACAKGGVDKFIFSSSAAVYGDVADGVASESTTTEPMSPYGRSKLMAETILADVAMTSPLRFVALRYFNVAGADPEGRGGQGSKANRHLIKAACEVALGVSDSLEIFGADYDTPDGTCIRDFIHVADLADAHLKAMAYLLEGGPSVVLNCGYGRGHSVLEVTAAVERATNKPLSRRTGARRGGDPAALVADSSRLRALLGWSPKYDELDVVVASAIDWERKRLEASRSVRARGRA